ncbi:MAG: HmuY family protein [Rubricoccaceae bacterium]
MLRSLALATALSLGLLACDTVTPPVAEPTPLAAVTVTDLPADPPTGRDPATGRPTGTTNRFTLYSLRENRVVLASTSANRADSASTAWDIGFRGTTIIFNGGTSGPGTTAAQILLVPFDEVTEAPAEGYRLDAGGNFAIPIGADAGWYTYIPFEGGPGGYISPIPGRTIVLRLNDGSYAKVRILSYYRGRPAPPINPFTSTDRHYTFEFVHQPNRTRSFLSVQN